MEGNKKLRPVVTKFLTGRKLNIALAFISQSYFKILKTDHSTDIEFKKVSRSLIKIILRSYFYF